MSEPLIRVLVVEPEQAPYERQISTLKEMQSIVGGHIEAVQPFPEPVALVVNEDGKNLGLPLNRAIMDESGLVPVDMISGTFFVAGVGEEDFISLTDEQVQRYTDLYSRQAVLTVAREPGETPQQEPASPPKDPEQDRQSIRFIDAERHTLFTIPDGESITLTRFDGKEETFPCRFLDPFHFEAYGSAYHILEFALNMERSGNLYRPATPAEDLAFDTYEIFQLRKDSGADYEFLSYEYAKEDIRPEHYLRVYGGFLDPEAKSKPSEAVLEALYSKHNRDTRPCSRGTRSLSVSNIVTLNRGGERQAFYVNRVGFDECKEFLDPPKPPQNRTRSGKKKKREASK